MKIFRRSGLSCRAFSDSRGVGLPAYVCAIVLCFALCLMPGAARAQMAPLNDSDLGGISGQAGVSINLDGQSEVMFDILKFSDSQFTPNWIELHNVRMYNGADAGFFFSTFLKDEPTGLVTNFLSYYAEFLPDGITPNPNYDPIKAAYTWTANAIGILNDTNVQNGTIAGLEEGLKRVTADPIFYDVATGTAAAPGPGEGITYISIRDTSGINPRWISVGNFVFNAYNITNSIPLSAEIVNYMTANSYDNAALIAALALSATFNYLDPTSWTADDLVKLAAAEATPGPLAAAVSGYQAAPNVLQNQPLGSLAVDALRQGPSLYRMWAPTVGQGVRFDYQTTLTADALTYAYNTTATGALRLSNLTIAGSATGTLDNPADPSTWEFGGVSNVFKIGMIGDATNAPATMDVGTDSGGVTSVYMSLPMSGTIRVAEVNFGPNTDNTGLKNFGPIAIDGIQFHRLDIKLTP